MVIIMRFISNDIILSMRPIIGRGSSRMYGVENWNYHILIQDFFVHLSVSAAHVTSLDRRPIMDADIWLDDSITASFWHVDNRTLWVMAPNSELVEIVLSEIQ